MGTEQVGETERTDQRRQRNSIGGERKEHGLIRWLVKSTPDYFQRQKQQNNKHGETVNQDIGGSEIPQLIWLYDIGSQSLDFNIS